MNGSRSTSPRAGERASLDALSRTIEGLEARIEGLVGTGRDAVARKPAAQDARPDPLTEIRERQRMLEESRNRALAGAARPPIPAPPREDSLRREAERRLAEVYRPKAERPAAPEAPSSDAAMREIAQSLVSLREELKRDIAENVSREMRSLRSELHDLKSYAGGGLQGGDDLRAELARLGEGIDLLGHQARGRTESQDLKAEFEDLRSLMDGLAREDTVRHMERRWKGMEERIVDIDPQPLRDEVVSIAYRLDDIKSQLGTLNPNPAIRAMEDRLLAVAQAMEQLGRHVQPNDHIMAEQFAGLDLRLDEISRAIAAGSRASQSQEPELFNRLERRLTALADQIDQIGEDNNRRPNPAAELASRMEALAIRVEELASSDAGVHAAARLEERLDQLSRLLERTSRAPAPELTGFLSDISRKIDALDNGPVNDQLAERLEYLARRIDEIEQPKAAPFEDHAVKRLESRLNDIARKLDDTATGPAQDNRALASLESQIANLAALINRPAQQQSHGFPPELESRMASIEQYMETSDEYIIEAARQAAEAVMEAYRRNPAPAAVDLGQLAALAGDLRHLEDIAQSSEERTHRTFEALHDTLLQIAGRLDDMDQRLGGSYSPAQDDHYFDEEVPGHAAMPPRAAPANSAFAGSAPAEAPRAPVQPQRQSQQAEPAQARAEPAQARPEPVAARATAPLADMLLDDGDGALNLIRAETFNFSSPVIRTVEPDLAEAVEETAREFVARTPEMPATKVKAGFLNTITARFRKTEKGDGKAKAQRTEPSADGRSLVDPAPTMAPGEDVLHGTENELLEPGSGAPDIKKILERVRANQSRNSIPTDTDRADLIAAARRAAQAAANEVRSAAPKPGREKDVKGQAGKSSTASAGTSMISRHRRPILLAVGAVLLVVMTMPLVNTFLHGRKAPAPIETSVEANLPAASDADMAPVKAPEIKPAPAAEIKAPEADVAPAQPMPPQQAAAPKAEAAPAPAEPAAAPVAQVPAPQAAAPASPLLTQAANGDAQHLDKAPAAAPATLAAAPAAPQADAIPVPATLEPKALADAARSGDPLALFEIGARYTEGRGVTADLAVAAEWYQRAADKGFAPAQYRLANLYEKGTGVARDLSKARDYYEKAARSGNASAMHNLAVLYATGVDGKPDTAAAVQWFAQAADYGVADSQFNLAILYARGNGTAQDLEQSYKWFAIAAKGGDKDAAQKRDDVANAMRPDQLQDARAKVDLWKVKPLDPKANATDIPDAWAGKGQKTATVDMKKAIRNIQAILNNNGFDAGTPDGEMGAKTVTAIKAFQKKVGMEPDGRISDRLVKELLAKNK